jgi:hypothetical protein
MPDYLLAGDLARNIAEFEVWCRAARSRSAGSSLMTKQKSFGLAFGVNPPQYLVVASRRPLARITSLPLEASRSASVPIWN